MHWIFCDLDTSQIIVSITKLPSVKTKQNNMIILHAQNIFWIANDK